MLLLGRWGDRLWPPRIRVKVLALRPPPAGVNVSAPAAPSLPANILSNNEYAAAAAGGVQADLYYLIRWV